MRFEGIVKSWNDERAFGFIEPLHGGQEIFIHITALPPRSGRPPLNQRISFEVERNRDGKKRAARAQLIRAPVATPVRPRRGTAGWGGASLFAVPAFVAMYLVIAIVWRMPYAVAVAYVTLSILCFAVYAADKSAARSGGWRTREDTLLVMGLLGGWPGALLAQQLLRHKSAKASFRAAFWATVVINVLAFLALSSPKLGAWSLVR
jgi:uncharacterized membrane protein YsdA (DUF1294 family)/cold shock CspA family protein